MPEKIFLDTETTGLGSPPQDKVVEIAIINYDGDVLLDTLINPERPIGFTTCIHGITDDMVMDAPTFEELWGKMQAILTGKHIIIFNAAFDIRFFPDQLNCADRISCAMAGFQRAYRAEGGNSRRYNLRFATDHIGYSWEGEHHRALADTLAARSVWLWIEKKIDEGVFLNEANSLESSYSFDLQRNSSLDPELSPYPISHDNQMIIEQGDTVFLNGEPNNWLRLPSIKINNLEDNDVAVGKLIGRLCGDIISDFRCDGLLLTIQIANVIRSGVDH